MAVFDFDAALRWARFDPQRSLRRRPDHELPFVGEDRLVGQALLLDTCVYIDQIQDRSPEILDRLIGMRQVNHSTVAIQELMHTVGVLDPTHPDLFCQTVNVFVHDPQTGEPQVDPSYPFRVPEPASGRLLPNKPPSREGSAKAKPSSRACTAKPTRTRTRMARWA